MLTREMFCHRFFMLDGGGAGDGGFGGYNLSMETEGITPGPESTPSEIPGMTQAEVAEMTQTIDLSAPTTLAEAYPGPTEGIFPTTGETMLTGESGGGIKELVGGKIPISPVAPALEIAAEEAKVTEAKGVPKPRKRQRRPTIFSEEFGLMYSSPGKRRSLLGG